MTIILFFFLSMAAILYLVYVASAKTGTFLDRFTNKISLITGFLAAFGIYLTYRIFEAQADNLSNDITLRLIDRSWIDLNEIIKQESEKCPTLINSLYYPWQKSVLGNNSNNSNNNDDWTTCSYISIKMFQAWEDYLTLASVDETGSYVWMANFVQWAKSDVLKKNWDVLKSNFSITTIEFGDFLFKSVKEYTPQNADDHLDFAIKLSESKELKNIKDKRNNVSGYSII